MFLRDEYLIFLRVLSKRKNNWCLGIPHSGAVIALAAAVLLAASAHAPALAQEFEGKFGQAFSDGGEFIEAEGLAIGPDGDLYVTDIGRQMVFKFDQDGTLLESTGDTSAAAGGLTTPGAVAVGSDGRVYVVDRGNDQMHIYDEDLNPLSTIGSICVDPSVPGANCVDPDGDGPLAVGDGQFYQPNGIAFDEANSRVLVADSANHRVQVFDADGNFILKFGTQGNGNGQFATTSGVSALPSGEIVVADGTNHNIQIFDDNGNFSLKFGSQGSGAGQLDSPIALDTDAASRIYVSERGNHRIQVFESDGTAVSDAGSECYLVLNNGCVDPDGAGPLENGDGQFLRPNGIAVDPFGKIFVADEGNYRVQWFALDSDGDSFPDLWEIVGIDVDGNGSIDLQPDELGSDFNNAPITLDWQRKDILVEIDYFDCNQAGGDCAAGATHSHEPMDSALSAVVQAFANAPVDNPGAPGSGINLWVQVDEDLAHQQNCDLDDGCFDTIKQASFGTPAERSDPLVIDSKRLLFRYNLWVHDKNPGNSSSGEADGAAGITGDDFVVSLGSWSGNIGTLEDQTGTFMHELGHTLGLGHGGGDNKNCKPNYLSIMSYLFQTRGLQPTDIFDFSRTALPNAGFLKEDNLNENLGIQDGAFTTFYGPPADTDGDGFPDWLVGDGFGNIDWDNNGDDTDNPATPAEINFMGIRGCGGVGGTPDGTPTDTHTGYVDWDILDYDFRDSALYTDGVHTSPEVEELDYDTALFIQEQQWQAGLERIYEYAAKFVCGVQPDPDGMRLAVGRYASIVNVRNPNRKKVTFRKSLSLAYPPAEQRGGERYRIGLDTLEYNQALKADCEDIRDRVFEGQFPTDYIDGFLVIQSPESLDVAGVYTTATFVEDSDRPGQPDAPGQGGDPFSDRTEHSSIEIERVPERIVDLRMKQPDLIIDKNIEFDANCRTLGVLNVCNITVRFTVRNIGDAFADPFTVILQREADTLILGDVEIEAGLDPEDSVTETISAEFSTDPNQPELRKICLRADAPVGAVDESREDNNDQCFTF